MVYVLHRNMNGYEKQRIQVFSSCPLEAQRTPLEWPLMLRGVTVQFTCSTDLLYFRPGLEVYKVSIWDTSAKFSDFHRILIRFGKIILSLQMANLYTVVSRFVCFVFWFITVLWFLVVCFVLFLGGFGVLFACLIGGVFVSFCCGCLCSHRTCILAFSSS